MLSIKKIRLIPAALTLIFLAACSSAVSSPTVTVAPTDTPEPTAAPAPFAVLMTNPDIPSPAQDRARAEAREYIAAQGWELREVQPGPDALQVVMEQNPQLIVFVGTGLGDPIASAAAARPDLRFVAVEDPGVSPAANLLVVGGENIRSDQAAFLAGLMAGVANTNDRVGWVGESVTVRGKSFRNGFRHGVRLVCPVCYIFEYELASTADVQAGKDAANGLLSDYADTASAGPNPAGTAALLDLAGNNIRVAGTQPDFYDSLVSIHGVGVDQVLGSPTVRPDLLLRDLLPRFVGGETFDQPVAYSIENGGLDFAEFPNDWISAGKQAFIRAILDDVKSGRLDVGVDPSTGEER
jgi:basic membrane protein A and related proteins